MKKLYSKINSFEKECLATIRSDMAKRIMHSVLPAVEDPRMLDISHSLDRAIEGKDDIIKYGVIACCEELIHYQDYNNETKFAVENSKNNLERMKVIDICIKSFSDSEKWMKRFGGYAWEKIAKSLKNLIILDNGLKIIKEDKNNPDDKIRHQAMDKEIKFKKYILLEMNIFDGLSHNSASIMNNLIEAESKDIHPEEINPYGASSRSIKEFPKTMRLMDSKELKNPIDTYKEIEETLKESGDYNIYNDYHHKLKNHTNYNSSFEEREKELFIIKNRKIMNPYISIFSEILEIFKTINDKNLIDSKYLNDFINQISDKVSDLSSFNLKGEILQMKNFNTVSNNITDFIENNNKFIKEIEDLFNDIMIKIKSFKYILYKITKPLDSNLELKIHNSSLIIKRLLSQLIFKLISY